MGKIFLDKQDIKKYFDEFVDNLVEQGVPEEEISERVSQQYTNVCIRKYSNDEQDSMWAELYHLIMEVPGGYWQIIENMNYMPEFEHRRFKCLYSSSGKKGTKKIQDGRKAKHL